jgi:kynureninase
VNALSTSLPPAHTAPLLARDLDAADPLRALRERFHLPRTAGGSPCVYFCGHSLGLAPRSAAEAVNEELTLWAQRGVEGHFDPVRPWTTFHERLATPLAELSGALRCEVVAMNTLTVNLHLMLTSFYRPSGSRTRILIEQRAFSSDRYAVDSHIRLHGLDPQQALLQIGPREGEPGIRTEDVCELLEREGRQIATVLLSGVQYLSGQRFDMASIASCARRQGCVVGFDLAHAIGNVQLQLHDWNADFAVWCGYKYLNGGPGAIGGCFVHERHARAFDLPRLAGWWGHDTNTRFAMPEAFGPQAGASGWQVSNLPILSAAPLLASLALFQEAGMDALRAKSLRLTGYLESLLRSTLSEAVTILTPAEPLERGCQLSLRLRRASSEAKAVYAALIRDGFICDWREPDVIRVAPVPLYNTFTEVQQFVTALAREMG